MSDDFEPDELYNDVLGVAGDLCAKYPELAVAAVLNTVSLTLYKTILTPQEYKDMMITIDSNTHRIKLCYWLFWHRMAQYYYTYSFYNFLFPNPTVF